MQSRTVISLPLVSLALLSGICTTLLLPDIPTLPWTYFCAVLAASMFVLQCNTFLRLLCLVCCGFAYMSWHVNQHVSHVLPEALEKQKITIIGNICSVVEFNKNQSASFNFIVRKISYNGNNWVLPAVVKLKWDKPQLQLLPGDSLSLQVKLKKLRNYYNPYSFDTEKFYFQQRITATGYVLGINYSDNSVLKHNIFSNPINKIRQLLLQHILKNLDGQTFSGVIIALIIGTKNNITCQQQQVFQNSGVMHLMSISGLHMGIICSFMFIILRVLWRYVPVSWLYFPGQWFAALGALLVSIIYGLLAGFSIATQRSLIMIVVFLLGFILKRKVSNIHAYSLALFLVLLHDPFVVLSIGFWLSFAAVGILIYALHGRITSWWYKQLVISIGLLPVTLICFWQYAFVTPIANLIAIPWVSFVVLPLALLGTIFIPINSTISAVILNIASKSFGLLWPILLKLSEFPVYNWSILKDNLVIITISAIAGLLLLFAPRGLPGRYLGILGILPLFLSTPEKILPAQAQFTLLDVGQGLAAVIRTKNHVLVYDTGAQLNESFDLGSRVVAPFLQANGINKINVLMISHADNDHIGGATNLIKKVKTDLILTTAIYELLNFNPQPCIAGQYWEWDGVRFTVLHPQANVNYIKRNNNSCVLMVQAGDHKVLLTGDIEAAAEKQLIMRYGDKLRANIMLVPHHGSKTSSTNEFIQMVQPEYALIPSGYKNQYGHPKPQILGRYNQLNIPVFNTALDGAISFMLGGEQLLQPRLYKHETRKFWTS